MEAILIVAVWFLVTVLISLTVDTDSPWALFFFGIACAFLGAAVYRLFPW